MHLYVDCDCGISELVQHPAADDTAASQSHDDLVDDPTVCHFERHAGAVKATLAQCSPQVSHARSADRVFARDEVAHLETAVTIRHAFPARSEERRVGIEGS